MNSDLVKPYMAPLVALLFMATAAVVAQKPVSQADVVTETFTIVAIDQAARIVTLEDKDHALADVVCGPEVQRFDALKVGDRVTLRYHESIISSIHRPGTPAKDPVSGGVTRTPGDKPGGTISRQMTATVTIETIDPKVPSVTIKRSDGRKMSFKIADRKNLEGYKAGDLVEVTYTQALAISVTPAK